MAQNFIPHICGKNRVNLPDSGCNDCTRLETRVTALENLVEKKITISQRNRNGDSITAEVLGEVVD